MLRPTLSDLQKLKATESTMSNANFLRNLHVPYGRNLVRATRDFLQGALGVRVSSQALAATGKVDRAGKVGGVGSDELHRLAVHYESVCPNLAAELRMISKSAA